MCEALSFTSPTACRTHATSMKIKSLDLEETCFNKFKLDLLFNHIKVFNQHETFNDENIEDTVFYQYFEIWHRGGFVRKAIPC